MYILRTFVSFAVSRDFKYNFDISVIYFIHYYVYKYRNVRVFILWKNMQNLETSGNFFVPREIREFSWKFYWNLGNFLEKFSDNFALAILL